jgi:hypothetical protein
VDVRDLSVNIRDRIAQENVSSTFSEKKAEIQPSNARPPAPG